MLFLYIYGVMKMLTEEHIFLEWLPSTVVHVITCQ